MAAPKGNKHAQKPRGTQRDHSVTIPLTHGERHWLQGMAKAAKVSIAEYSRGLLFKGIGKPPKAKGKRGK